MPMKYRVLEETKSNFEKELADHFNDGWIPQYETKQTVVQRESHETGDYGRIYYDESIIHTILLLKWEDDTKEETAG